MINNKIVYNHVVYVHDTTTNQSFMDMYHYLKAKGIQNNKFFLAIYDPDLIGIDPRDPNLSYQMKQKVLRECIVNFWYFIREVVRIPEEGGSVEGGTRYKLHRGNLALNYLFIQNHNIFLELPRQHGKTVSACVWYLWLFNFGTANSKMIFINKKHDDAKNNLKTLKNIRESLPVYLQMDAPVGIDGKKIKVPNTTETIQHPINRNVIKTLASARNKSHADGAGRGMTVGLQYFDEFGFIPYNKIMYMAAYPAFSRASENAKRNKSYYGILITTTPGDLTTDEGVFANSIRLNATPWNELYYDKTDQEIRDIVYSNNNSTYIYIRYTYQQLGSSEEWFANMVKGMEKDWQRIRREVLLEWAGGSMNCPFADEDLDIIKSMCRSEPLNTILFGNCGQYQLHIWNRINKNPMYPPIIGVDASGAFQRDSSTITIIDSETTAVMATFNCNYIPTDELAKLLYDLVKRYMPNAIINIEKNGGFGATLLQLLIKTDIKKNLYYEIKDKIIEERSDGVKIIQHKQKTKMYGSDNTHTIRNKLMELLFNRVANHKDKFIAPILYEELTTMETKKNGRIEHAASAHDDQIFSYLWALYVWYYGENLMERFHIFKNEIHTDEDITEELFDSESRYGNNEISKFLSLDDEILNEVEDQYEIINSNNSMSIEEFNKVQLNEELNAIRDIASTKYGRQALSESLHMTENDIINKYNTFNNNFDIVSKFYQDEQEILNNDNICGNLSDIFRES